PRVTRAHDTAHAANAPRAPHHAGAPMPTTLTRPSIGPWPTAADSPDAGVPTQRYSLFAATLPAHAAFFEMDNFQGRCLEVSWKCQNMAEREFQPVRYISVDCGPSNWTCFQRAHTNSSMISQDTGKHKISLFKIVGFQGGKMEIVDNDVLSLWLYGFQDRVASVKVSGGVWFGYHYPGYRGSQCVFEIYHYSHFNEWDVHQAQMQSVRRVQDQQWYSCSRLALTAK
uniref:Crystallin, beta B3 n=1 Tax=Eptatretus burgeri TaxID=7764 RepID=A0A8C4WXP8_EPTBU